ncbi:MAG: phosphate acyltransferase PlsX [Alphaproteobacteria bacterium]|nr:MAG: phosphate acyltransferase PlsX [Alphaproteobacteria bacterium]TAF13523.1 MAG: phosphate acyltransferase PlsX [Alphaproteobacteria bacterium]TAF40560.1 MAG: phosphate acyltransferase PlsX [Alphaproteobacteria bacterium]TAF76043.1 MAG: phosphate acyltransferase PlsX [Alphaproteobacteria bacterium]
MTNQLPLAIDAMGGDRAPKIVIRGLKIMHHKQPHRRFMLFGNEKVLNRYFMKKSLHKLRACCEIVHTDVVVSSHEKPSVALRQAKNSSMRLAIEAVRDGRASGVVSSGNTGAFMALSKMVLKTLPHVSRPAIVGLMPNRGSSIVMLDIGANVQCDATDLYQFALMGEAFSRIILNETSPRVGLLNIGSEEMKGHETLHLASEMLKQNHALNYVGYVEGNDICNGNINVVVTDGFTGNVSLKTLEGTARYFSQELKRVFIGSWTGKLSYLLAKSAFVVMKRRLDPRRYNGAMFLGLNGIAVKSHGGADGYAFYHAMKTAYILIDEQINTRLVEELSRYDLLFGRQEDQGSAGTLMVGQDA